MTEIEKAELALNMLEEGLQPNGTGRDPLWQLRPIILDLLLEAEMLESWNIYRLDKETATKENEAYCCYICNAYQTMDHLKDEIAYTIKTKGRQ